jgi:hypothetical protein
MAKPLKIRNEPDFLQSFTASLRGPCARSNPEGYGKNTGLLRPFGPRNDISEMFIKLISYEHGLLRGQNSYNKVEWFE